MIQRSTPSSACRRGLAVAAIAALSVLGACSEQAASPAATTEAAAVSSTAAAFAAVTTERIKNTSAQEEWLTYGGTYDEQRHSALTSINTENVDKLGVAWTFDLKTNRGVESTPIVVDGVMYVTSAWSLVYALDAKTGESLWTYDPQVDKAVGVKACCDVVNRGVAVYEGQVFVGVIDGRLEALNAKSGELNWSVVTVDQSKPYTITGAPRVVDGRVMIGNGGAELGVRGYLSAYDASSGEKIWRFYTVPNPNKQPDNEASDAAFVEIGNVTWGDEGRWVTDGGGGTVWDSIVYDEVNDQIIFGVGNGSPWNRNFRDPAAGDNLFLSSIVAVDAATGKYRWHFQTTPGDNWDYTATQTIILADLPLGENGAPLRVAMQAPKNGFFYVINAQSGEFISGKAYGPVDWATGLDENGRPIEAPGARYGDKSIVLTPGPLGAHNWHPMAFNPELQLAYIPAQEIPGSYQEDARFITGPVGWNTGADFSADIPPMVSPADIKGLRATLKGRLIAWDPKTQSARWSVEHSNAWNGGVLSTAGGLVFQGKLNGEFAAYNAATGDPLWSYNVLSGAASGPGTYAIDGEQYLTITTGWGSAYGLTNGLAYDQKVKSTVGKVVTFKLGATGTITPPDMPSIDRSAKAETFGDEATIAHGMVAFARNCAVCHGALAISSGVLPDLRWSAFTGDAAAWNSVVLEGALAANGMVSFAQYINTEDAEAIRAYVLTQAHTDMQTRDAAVAVR
ncbi:MAG: quinohemoprotein ethanol dehydrogenase [Paraglaciecola psychrophila]|jgi:quinohemoprotein ethanol dehydrogenase